MERLSDKAIDIINELHAERLDYYSEYLPLIDAAQRLAQYEDLDEKGRLVELPCAVGEKVWSTLDDLGRLHECEVVSIHCGRKTHENYIELEPVDYRGRKYGASFGALGKTVFLTRHEAEDALAAESGVKEGE